MPKVHAFGVGESHPNIMGSRKIEQPVRPAVKPPNMIEEKIAAARGFLSDIKNTFRQQHVVGDAAPITIPSMKQPPVKIEVDTTVPESVEAGAKKNLDNGIM